MNPLELVAASGTVGAGGAGFPTHVKLAAKNVEFLIMNAAECEPLLHTNKEMIRHDAPLIIRGLLAARELTGATRTVIAIKAHYKDAIAALEAALKAAGNPPVEIFGLPNFYPAGDEHAIVNEVTGRVVPENGLPLDVGCVVQNVETLANVAAALEGRPVIEKWVTVTGAVREPVTLKVPVGTPIATLVAAAGGATVRDWAVVDGGPMMGKVVTDPARPVTKTTGGLIVLPRSHVLITRPQRNIAVEMKMTRSACIRCRMCTDLCPRYLQGHDLQPHQVMQSLALFPLTDAIYDQAWLCCECGICEVFSCPMGLSPRWVLGHLKREFGAQGRRYPKKPKTYKFREGYEYRRIPGKRLLLRLGLDEYDRPAPYRPSVLNVPAVTLLLRQHIGAPAVPVVKEGDRVALGQPVAEVPQGKLGAPIHASIAGVVTRVTADAIHIQEVRDGA
ncbi:MAG TPA: 4Fe-4S dicluster domain-containing protein [Symbiobacteriaceae bacterium]|jgi:RnfABCDGE-type electron transport complex C subunit